MEKVYKDWKKFHIFVSTCILTYSEISISFYVEKRM